MPLRQQKYKKHILGFSQKHACANKKALITFASKTAKLSAKTGRRQAPTGLLVN